VTTAIKDSVGRDVAVDVKVDETLIGGLVVRVGSRMMDGSIRTKLQNLQLAMKEVA
jgi:F-type H+-transporting ATPase subunit delta